MAEQSKTPGKRTLQRVRQEKPPQIAYELRQLIVTGELDEGGSLGTELSLIERFGSCVHRYTKRCASWRSRD